MNRQSFKNWANIEGEGEAESKSGASPAMLRLPYALAKEKGLNTDGMTPRQVWDLLKSKGVNKAAEEKKFIDNQKAEMKQASQDEPEQFFEEPTAEEIETKKLKDFIEKYKIRTVYTPDLKKTIAGNLKDNPEAIKFARENKDALVSLIENNDPKIKAEKEKEQKIKSIEGLERLEKAASDWSNYNYDEIERFSDMMKSEGGGMRKNRYEKPTETLSELNKMYPRAAAYREAQNYERASNAAKAAAGMRAKERIINGEDPQKVIKEMEEEWSKAAERAVWNS